MGTLQAAVPSGTAICCGLGSSMGCNVDVSSSMVLHGLQDVDVRIEIFWMQGFPRKTVGSFGYFLFDIFPFFKKYLCIAKSESSLQ
ncbi:hypothetical protein GRJ2_000426600 [Grus japonensis]|uniref:Uncharacterized protein n=1 Tax=Grus japonensis TaxID=30415 RepID=A0ABC9W284_GRUJA